ncbi:MAG: hypothetical protein KME59_22440 [Trichormus sp. ATA11-4-KO1]|jgi:hypothetical protein|nr:hypothetical protein [Trichormus sp. ATA11-4-KO1]
MQTILTSTILHYSTEVNHPTVSPLPTSKFSPPVLPLVHQPNWLLALMVLTVLAKRLHQVLVAALYLLREWRKMGDPKTK